jgi:hypothetical protein
MPDIACKLISQLKTPARAVFQGLCINYATKTADVQALTDSTICIYGAAVRRLTVRNKQKTRNILNLRQLHLDFELA